MGGFNTTGTASVGGRPMNEVHDFFKRHRQAEAKKANPEPVSGATGFDCMTPLEMDTPKGKQKVSCRKCTNCRKGWRQDLSGRIMSHAQTSARVYFVSATYGTWVDGDGVKRDRHGAMSFDKRHWVKFIARLRAHAKRRYGSTIRAFYAFERGLQGTLRCHLHALLMSDGPIGWDGTYVDARKVRADATGDAKVSKRKAKPAAKLAQLRYAKTTQKVVNNKRGQPELVVHREGDFMEIVHLPAWAHGHLNIVELTNKPASEMIQSVRYIAKYAMKEIDGPEDAPWGYSTDGLGYEFLRDLAQQHVDQGLLPQSYYWFEGVKFSRGRYAGQHERFHLRGAAAKVYAVAYREAYELKHPDGQDPWKVQGTAPARPFHLTHDDCAVDPVLTDRHRKRPTGWKERQVVWVPHDCTASKVVHHWVPPTPEAEAQAYWTSIKDQVPLPAPWTREVLGSFQMDADGLVAYVPTMGGPPIWMGADVCQVEHLSDDDFHSVQEWAEQSRGPGWKPPEQRDAERNAVSAALLSQDIGSRLAVLVLQADGAERQAEAERKGIPKTLDPELRKLILAAKLGTP
jgi:hypothetical protein